MVRRKWVVLLTGCVVAVAAICPQAVAVEGDDGEEFLNAETAKPDWAPLEIKLPKPMFVGTPKDIKTENLEKITGKKRKPFLAPKDVVNVAFEKPVTASDMEPIIGDIEQITDGDKEGADGSFVELGPDVQWAQVDLGEVFEISCILVWHYHQEARVYHDMVIRCADDKDFITNVKTLFNNDHDNSSGLGVGKDKEYIEVNEGRLIDTHGAKTRFIRLYSNGNTTDDLNHYIEIEVYGKPPE